MENNIQLGSTYHSNSYLHHFKIAQFNLRLVIKEEPGYRKRFKPKYQTTKSS
jgi:hypothetical protein